MNKISPYGQDNRLMDLNCTDTFFRLMFKNYNTTLDCRTIIKNNLRKSKTG